MTARKICIDARMIHSSGIGTYLQGLLAGLSKQSRPDLAFALLGDRALLPKGPWSVHPVSAPIYSVREQWEIPSAARQTKASLFHAPHYNMPVLLASRAVVTVYDLIHLKFPQYWPSLAARSYARFFFHCVVPKARAILTISDCTKRDLINMLSIPEDRITVAYPAVSHARFRNPDPSLWTEFNRLGLPQEYLLYLGNLKEFKNVERLVEAYRLLRSRRKDCPALVLAGRNFIPGFEETILQTPGIRRLGEVRGDLLPHLYQKALCFIFPSLYEGFGLPPLEAMAAGTPVLCSARGSLPEVVGEAAILINPERIDAIAAGMERLIDDSGLRRELSEKGLLQAAKFSWDRMTSQTLAVYERCLG